jgi:hypothetical protein
MDKNLILDNMNTLLKKFEYSIKRNGGLALNTNPKMEQLHDELLVLNEGLTNTSRESKRAILQNIRETEKELLTKGSRYFANLTKLLKEFYEYRKPPYAYILRLNDYFFISPFITVNAIQVEEGQKLEELEAFNKFLESKINAI